MIAAIEARRAGASVDRDPEISPEEEDAVALFFALRSQWRVHPLAGIRTGIDYAAIAPTAALLGLAVSPELFDDITLMERAALAAFTS